jgi:pseudouridylate synthase
MIQLSSEVSSAIAAKGAVVALESTVIAHGLPQPTNLETAARMEANVRELKATPATIGIIDGSLIAGLDQEQIRLLAKQEGIKKVSTRDLPLALSQRWNGATTVASTSWIAHRAGIKVFATGGIGGVHRGTLPDISADLPELARTPIIVVCSGAKIVLDLPATREWLETHAITVVGYQCDQMPAFYSRESGLPVDARADSPNEIAKIFHAQRELGLDSALLVTVPVPAVAEVPADLLDRTLKTALNEAETQEVSGRDLTPFLLSQMSLASAGATLRANIALLENNARVAAQIALSLS